MVFREPAALRHLLPALFSAWPHIASEHAVSDASKREALELSMLETIETELLHVAPYVHARRIYFQELPVMFAHLGLKVCVKLQPLLTTQLEHLLGAELSVLAAESPILVGKPASADERGRLHVAMVAICDALRLTESMLRVVWPRVAAHAPYIAQHTIAAYLRSAVVVASFGGAGGAFGDADSSAMVLKVTCSILRLVRDAGGAEICTAAMASAQKQCASVGGVLHEAATLLADAIESL